MLAHALLTFAAAALAAPLRTAARASSPTVRQVYQFANNGTWVENLAVRSNGDLLLTRLDVPELYLLDPRAASPEPTLVHAFPGAADLLGIAEVNHDQFVVVAGTQGVVGSWKLWSVTFSGSSVAAKVVATLPPNATLANGVTALPLDKTKVLVADSGLGAIWRADITTGVVDIAVQDPSFAGSPAGINGVHVRGDELFYTVSSTSVFGSMRITSDGLPASAGSASRAPVQHSIAQLDASQYFLDDFALSPVGTDAFVAAQDSNTILHIQASGAYATVAGGANSTVQIVGPTAVAWGRGAGEEGVLYVSTDGGLAFAAAGGPVVGAQVLAIDMKTLL